MKRKSGGGVRFSKDPLNLTNTHSRKVCSLAHEFGKQMLIGVQQAGFVNDKVRLHLGVAYGVIMDGY